jgi:hypothetical protein
MAAQDDVRETELIHRFNLVQPPDRKRHGTNAILLIDGHQLEFELKSVTKAQGSISTVRDFGPRHIEKWRHKHWIVGFFNGTTLQGCKYGSPSNMAEWVADKWEYVRVDFEMAKIIPGLITYDAMYKAIGQKKSTLTRTPGGFTKIR